MEMSKRMTAAELETWDDVIDSMIGGPQARARGMAACWTMDDDAGDAGQWRGDQGAEKLDCTVGPVRQRILRALANEGPLVRAALPGLIGRSRTGADNVVTEMLRAGSLCVVDHSRVGAKKVQIVGLAGGRAPGRGPADGEDGEEHGDAGWA